MHCMLHVMEPGNVVILPFSAQTAEAFICETCNENKFLKFPLCYLDSLASLMTNSSKVAFALVRDLIKWLLMSEDSTLNYFIMWVLSYFFLSFLFAGFFSARLALINW